MGCADTQKSSLGFLLNDVARLLRRNFNRLVQDMGLTQAQWQALFHISRNPGIKQTHLADILEVQPISVARLIDRMECAGWVERQKDPCDRRAFNLYLTDKAEPILEKLQTYATETRSKAVIGLSEKEQSVLLQNLSLIRKNLIEETC